MGGVQYLIHHAYEGKPKATGNDNFDRLLQYRDERLKEEAKVRARNPAERATLRTRLSAFSPPRAPHVRETLQVSEEHVLTFASISPLRLASSFADWTADALRAACERIARG
jgi:hypothetical protein